MACLLVDPLPDRVYLVEGLILARKCPAAIRCGSVEKYDCCRYQRPLLSRRSELRKGLRIWTYRRQRR
jgi:hypothetical protein